MTLLDCACHVGGAYRPPCTIPGGCGSAGCACAEAEPTCLLCSRRPQSGRVCDWHQEHAPKWLADLPRLVRRLELELVPSMSAAGERITSSSPHSAPAARLAAMNLRVSSAAMDGPHPWWWQPPNDLDPGDRVDGPVQVGMPSVPTWVRGWAREWRARHDHSTRLVRADPTATPTVADPTVAPRPRPPAAPPTDATPEQVAEHTRRLRAYRAEFVAWLDRARIAVQPQARSLLALGAALPLPDRPDDPLADEWQARHGTPTEHYALGRDTGYLAAWLPRVWDDETTHPDLAEFLHGLRALHKAATVVLEGRSVDRYCGRCPTSRTDQDGNTAPCGVDLWIDPYVERLHCRRCGTDTPRVGFLALRAAQLEHWTAEELSEPASVRVRRAGRAAA